MTLDENTLTSNGIIRSQQNNNELRCFLCSDDNLPPDLQSHMKDSQHLVALRQFRLIFAIYDERINCLACNSVLEWSSVEKHANWHRIVPWYEITDKSKIFFENRIIHIDSSYDCLPCGENFAQWSEAFVHIGEAQHQNLLSREPPLHESFVPTGTTYEILCDEGYEPWGSTSVKCRICEMPNVALKNIAQHTEMSEHKSAKVKFREKFAKNVKKRTNNVINDNCSISSTTRQQTSRNHQRASSSTGRFQNLRNNSNNNRRGQSPATFRKFSGDTRERRFSTSETMKNHGNTDKTRKAQTLENFPVQKRENDRWCTICDESVVIEVVEHLKLDRHLSQLRRYGYEHVVPFKDGKYRCETCVCVVPNLENVFRHIKGLKHRVGLPKDGTTDVATRNREKSPTRNKEKSPTRNKEKSPTRNKEKSPTRNKEEDSTKRGRTTSFKMNFPPATRSIYGQPPNAIFPLSNVPLFGQSPGPNYPQQPLMNYHQQASPNFPQQAVPNFPQMAVPNYPQQPVPNYPQHSLINFPQQLVMQNSPQPLFSQQTPKTFTKSAWETLPRDYIVVQSPKDLFCRLCDCAIYGHDNVDKHIYGHDHKKSIEQFCATITWSGGNLYYCKRCNCEISGRDKLYNHVSHVRHKESAQKIPTTRNNASTVNEALGKVDSPSTMITGNANDRQNSDFSNVSNGCIVKLGGTDFCCKICYILLQDHTKISQHLEDVKHLKSLKLVGKTHFMDDGKYWCKSCGCTIPNFANVPLHAIGAKHRNLAMGSNNPPVKISPELERELARDYIAAISDTDYYCRICNVCMYERSSVDEHKIDGSHIMSLKKYGCWKVQMIDGKRYYCEWCKCNIPDFENAFVHLSGKRHMQNFSEGLDKSGSEEKESAKEAVEVTNVGENKKENLTTYNEIITQEGCKTPKNDDSSIDSIDLRVKELQNRLESFDISKPWDSQSPVDPNREKITPKESEDLQISDSNDKSRKIEDYENLIETIISGSKKADDIAEKSTNAKIQENMNDNLSTPSKISPNYDQSTNDSSLRSSTSPSEKHEDTTKKFKTSNETLDLVNDDFVRIRSIASSTMSLNEIGGNARKRRTPRAATAVTLPVNVETKFDELDRIHAMSDKKREISKAIKLCMIKNFDDIYCLICRKKMDNTLANINEHFCNLEHCEFYEGMEKDHAVFEIVPGQFSELDLAAEYMEEISEDSIFCHVCNVDMDNIDDRLKEHMADAKHKEKRDEMREKAEKTFKEIEPRLKCDWYYIFKYMCVPCSVNFDNELAFVRHAKSSVHMEILRKKENIETTMFHDFCSPCALLWYGYRHTYANHCDLPAHKWQIKDEDYLSPKIPGSLKCLLGMPKEYIDDTLKYLNEIQERNIDKNQRLLDDLVKSVISKFAKAKTYAFGPRVAGLDSVEKDIQIYLDCYDMYDGSSSTEDGIGYLIDEVTKCLSLVPELWNIEEEILTKSPPNGIKVCHRITGVCCDILFDNGLAHEEWKLIGTMNDKFPACRKIILFVKQWLEFCGLYGTEMISCKAICWYVIFYLQRENLLPMIVELIEKNGKSRLVADWECGLSHDFTCDEEASKHDIKEFLVHFFAFYANFDYRQDVACPFLGVPMKKRDFTDKQKIPSNMYCYVKSPRTLDKFLEFDNYAAMCLQNPLCLAENLTSKMSKFQLNRFRTYCMKSLDILLQDVTSTGD